MISRTSRLSLFVLVGLFASCDNNRIYETNYDFEDQTWKVKETPEFEFRIDDARKKYNLYINVRNSLDYPYSRIFISYHLQDSTGHELQTKLCMQDLFNQKTGIPFGSSGIGDLYDHQFPILNNFEFNMLGSYKIKLEQFTRQDTLKGVLAVGLRVESVELD